MKKTFTVIISLLVLTACAQTDKFEFKEGTILDALEAKAIAEKSVCMDEGNFASVAPYYNEYTLTWWFDLDIDKEGCAPACVVSEETKTAEINWRCTGAIPE